MRCVFCGERKRNLAEGRVQGFWIAALVTLGVLVLATAFFPRGIEWLLAVSAR